MKGAARPFYGACNCHSILLCSCAYPSHLTLHLAFGRKSLCVYSCQDGRQDDKDCKAKGKKRRKKKKSTPSVLSWPCDRHFLTCGFNLPMRQRDLHFLCPGLAVNLSTFLLSATRHPRFCPFACPSLCLCPLSCPESLSFHPLPNTSPLQVQVAEKHKGRYCTHCSDSL